MDRLTAGSKNFQSDVIFKSIYAPHLSMENSEPGERFVSDMQPHEIALFHIYKDY